MLQQILNIAEKLLRLFKTLKTLVVHLERLLNDKKTRSVKKNINHLPLSQLFTSPRGIWLVLCKEKGKGLIHVCGKVLVVLNWETSVLSL